MYVFGAFVGMMPTSTPTPRTSALTPTNTVTPTITFTPTPTPTTALSLEFWSNKTGVGVPGVRVTLVDGQGQEQVAESDGGGRVQVDGLADEGVTLRSARWEGQEMLLHLNGSDVGGYVLPLAAGAETHYRLVTGENSVTLEDKAVTGLPRDESERVRGQATLVLHVRDSAGVGTPGVRVTLVDDKRQEWEAESDGGGRVQVDGLVGSFVRLMAARQGRQELALMLDTGTPQSVGGFLFPITQGQERVYDLTASGGTLAIHDMLLKMPATPAPTIEVAATVEAFTQENAEAVRSLALDAAQSSESEFVFTVQFANADGSLFSWALPAFITPSPGAGRERSEFSFSVVQRDGAIKVVGFPLYTP